MILFKLIEELKSDKYVFIFICIFIILIYHVYRNASSCKNNIEKMTPISDNNIAEAVRQYYISDDFLKTMSDISIKSQTEGLKIIGDVSIRGNIKARNEISNNQFSLSGTNNNINNKIQNIQRQQEILRQQKLEAERRRQRELENERRRQEEERKKQENNICNTNPQALLGWKTCNHWSWMDERFVQRYLMPNYYITGTVLPAHDCWYAKTSQCVSRDCMKSPNPDKACLKRFHHLPPPPPPQVFRSWRPPVYRQPVYRPPVYRPPVRYWRSRRR